ncbi:MAG TPA: hypothetical protein VFZ08_14705 [Terriglobia bacterium]|nr:hypothetical protein [Terriglobia bacterium]
MQCGLIVTVAGRVGFADEQAFQFLWFQSLKQRFGGFELFDSAVNDIFLGLVLHLLPF